MHLFRNKLTILTVTGIALMLLHGCASYWRCESPSCDKGKAVLTTEYGDRYEGEVKNGRPEGEGMMVYGPGRPGYSRGVGFLQGTKYNGRWGRNKEGYVRYYGPGVVTYPDGYAVSATWADSLPLQGPGSFTFPDGKEVRGTWGAERGDSVLRWICLQGDCHSGRGMRASVYSNAFYVGEFKDGEPEGRGMFVNFFQVNAGLFSRGSLQAGTVYCEEKGASLCAYSVKGSGGKRKLVLGVLPYFKNRRSPLFNELEAAAAALVR